MIPLFERVALSTDIEKHHQKRGDAVTLLDRMPHPAEGEMGVVVEVFNAVGESIMTMVLRESQIESLHAGEVLAVRSLARGARVSLTPPRLPPRSPTH